MNISVDIVSSEININKVKDGIIKIPSTIYLLIPFSFKALYVYAKLIPQKNNMSNNISISPIESNAANNTEIEIPIVPIIENTGDFIFLSSVNETIAHTANNTKNVMLLNISKCTKDINNEIYVLPIPQAVKDVKNVLIFFAFYEKP